MLKMLELRDYARTARGDKFDVRRFHGTILAGGNLPLTILGKRVREWVSVTSTGQ